MDKLQKFGKYSKRVIDRLTGRRGEDEEEVDLNFATVINEEERSTCWHIENIQLSPLQTGKYHESPFFCTGFTNEVKWAIRLYPRGRRIADKVGLFLHKITEESNNDLRIYYSLQAETTLSSSLKCETRSPGNKSKNYEVVKEKNDSREYGTESLCSSSYLFGNSDMKTFSVTCHLKVVYMDTQSGSFIDGIPKPTLQDDLKKMYKNGKFSDVTLQVGKRAFPAHKAILAARSEVFAAMFQHATNKENLTNVVPIEDIDPSVMNTVLQYMYTGKLGNLTMEEASSVFQAADKYSLDELQQWCVGIMLAKLSIDNVCQIAILADMHSVPKLKSATNYFFRRYMAQIIEKREWELLMNEKPQLATDIVRAVTSDFNFNLKKPKG